MKHVLSASLVFSMGLGLAGCATEFETRAYNPEKDADGIKNGIRYYEPKMVLVRYVYTQAVDKEGKIVGDSKAIPPTCIETVQKDDIQYLPDLSSPKVIIQKPSQFGQSQLTLGFNANGTLSSLNTLSQPSTAQLLGTLETAAKDKVLPFTASEINAACNSSPVIKSMRLVDNLGDIAP